MKRLATTALTAFLFLILVGESRLPVSAAENGPSLSGQPMIGEMAPGFDLDQVDGGTMSLEGLKGRYVVLHFGASW